MDNVPPSFLREIFSVIQDPSIISFAGGLPNPELFPLQAFEQAAQKVLSEQGKIALQYAGSEGYLKLREYICNQYKKKEGMDVTPDQILITNGSQQALDLIGKVLINNGDTVALESPTYLAAIQSLSLYGATFTDVHLEGDGPDIKKLAEIIKEKHPKILYCIPNFQNPTGITWSEEKRKAVAKLLKDTNTLFIEDDPYGEIRWSGKRPTTMTTLVDNAVLLGSFSKTVAPGLRLGWIYTKDAELYNKLYIAKQAADLHTSTFNQYVLYEYLAQGTSDEHIDKIAQIYKKQKDTLSKALNKYLPDVLQTNPDGGMFLWLTFPKWVDTHELFKVAITKKVAFVPGFAFYADAENAPKNTARLNFSNASNEQIIKGVQRLAEAYNAYKSNTTE